MGRLILGVILIIAGLSAILEVNIWQYFWPGVLILLGAWILLSRSEYERHHWREAEVVGEEKDALNYSASFQGIDRKVTTNNFKGGKISSTFGGVRLDLRDAKIKSKPPVVLEINTTFGGVKILVPKDWKVENNINGFAAGVQDSTAHPTEKERAGTLRLVGSATVGGIEISN